THVIEKGLTVRNLDVDGDGAGDIVVELAPDYAFERENHFKLRPGVLREPLNVRVGVEIFDPLQNLAARLGGPDATQTRVLGLITPGQVSKSNVLEPACLADCASATVKLDTANVQSLVFTGASLDALAAGNLTGQTPARGDLVLASAHENRGSPPNTVPN